MVDKYDVSTVHTILCAAAPLGKETADAVNKRLGYKNMRQGMFIDREAREIIRLVASVHPSVRPFVYALTSEPFDTWKINMTHGIQTKISVCLSVIR